MDIDCRHSYRDNGRHKYSSRSFCDVLLYTIYQTIDPTITYGIQTSAPPDNWPPRKVPGRQLPPPSRLWI